MKQKITYALIPAFLVLLLGCSGDTSKKIRYDMEKLSYAAGKIGERISIQPNLSTPSDSLELKSAHQAVLEYYYDHRADPPVTQDEATLREMERMAIRSQVELAKFYANQRQADSVIAAYRRVGTDIPAGPEDRAGATLALALMYRALSLFDSTFAIYDRLLAENYPPIDSLERVNTDVFSIPIDKMQIVRALDDPELSERFSREALEYYERFRTDFPNTLIDRTATLYIGRVYAMNEQWDLAIDQLEQIKDSTGVIDIKALVLVANIYNGPKNDAGRAIDLYREILNRNPDSSIIGPVMLRLGAGLCSRKEHEEGRKILVELKKKFERYPQLSSQAQLFYAQSFEDQNRWDRALSEFQWLMENHPYTEEAFRAALHIPEHFSRENDQKLANIWFDRAIDLYNRTIQNQQGRPIAIAAYTYLSDTYRRLGRWDEAMSALDKIYSMVPGTQMGARALFNAARVAYVEMKDSVLAQNYLDRLRSEFGTTDSAAIIQEETTDIDLENIE